MSRPRHDTQPVRPASLTLPVRDAIDAHHRYDRRGLPDARTGVGALRLERVTLTGNSAGAIGGAGVTVNDPALSPQMFKLLSFTSDKHYFEMLNDLAARVVVASGLLGELLADTSRVAELVPRIKDIEHDADRLMNGVDAELARALVTPMDVEDIHTLAYRIDSVIDLIDGTARRVRWFHIDSAAPEHARRLADVVAQSGGILAEAVGAIRRKKALSLHVRSVRLLEEEADALYHDGIAILFDGRHDPLEVIKWKEIYDRLEDTTDECQRTAQLVESLAFKYGGVRG